MHDDALAARLLREHRVLTVVGCSGTPGKPAHDVPLFMLEQGYGIVPVNPRLADWHGIPAFPRLADAPRPGLVVVFRPSAEAAGVVRQAIDAGARAAWLQSGIASDEARRLAEDAGLEYVEDRCVRVDWRRLQRRGGPAGTT